MGRRILAGLVLLILAAGFAPAPKKKPPGNKVADLQALQGAWEYGRTTKNAKKAKTIYLRQIKIERDTFTYQTVRNGQTTTGVSYTIKLDTTKNPPHIDMESTVGKRKRKMVGIYELKGDTLRIRYVSVRSTAAKKGKLNNAPGAQRPTGFTEGNGTLMTLTRVKP